MTVDSLATRCPSCDTAFRVVPDQLRLADGWVRCGRCGEVFDASQALVAAAAGREGDGAASAFAPDEETRMAAPVEAPAVPPAAAEPPDAPSRHELIHAAPPTSGVAAAEPGWIGLQRPSRDEATAEDEDEERDDAAQPPDTAAGRLMPSIVPDALPQALRPGPAPSRPASDFVPLAMPSVAAFVAEPEPAEPAPPQDDDEDAAPPADDLAAPGDSQPLDDAAPDFAATVAAVHPVPASHPEPAGDTPSFARPPAADPRWQRPAVRASLAAAAALLALGLPLQAALHWRDELAAGHPAARPALDALCRAAGCRVQPLRRIASVSIESSALGGGAAGRPLQLALTLRNRAALPLAVPWVDLTLTEVNGGVIARRALSPAELGAAAPTLAPGAETALQATLALDNHGRPPSGYTVEIFHP